jgi:hypothetical protein
MVIYYWIDKDKGIDYKSIDNNVNNNNNYR